ncbi:MAG TPA: PIN domain-containing protein [Mycobacteriales bacterium]|jgi:hypothetical protein|nr:PIN domain-containing protein [Mycobacteriales bacterium]
MIVCDTSGLYDAYDEEQERHAQARDVIEASAGPLLLSPFALAELDYLLLTRLGSLAEDRMLEDVAQGAYELCSMTGTDVAQAREITRRYTDLKLGLADASNVVIAARYQTTRILTFDHKHFRAITPLWGSAFTLLPDIG